MIALTVLSYNGAPADGPTAQFDELGGTIGRADSNQLVLPDPERTISRVHARIVFRAGRYAIVDNGSNPISVNGAPVGTGREHPLEPGDQLQIGGYLLKASDAAVAAAAADPFADLFNDAPLGLAAPAPINAPSAAPWPAAPAATPWPAAPAAAPWPPSPAPAPAWPGATPAAPTAAASAIPEDWDPFAPEPSPAAPPPQRAGADALFDLPRGGGDSIDDLFGLSSAPPAGDPLGTPQPLVRPNTAAHDDPLRSLVGPASVSAPSRPDHATDLHTPMPLPSVAAPAPAYAPPPEAPSPQAPAAAAALPAGAVFSWDEPVTRSRVVTRPGVRRPIDEVPPQMPPAQGQAAAPLAPPPAPPAATPMPAASARSPASAATATAGEAGPLVEALLSGLGASNLRLESLSPETMRLVGLLLREAMRGTVELLVARAALKREMRAEMTMIVARDNNPLKFSPTVEVALQHLLGPQTPGFMAPAEAVRDAFDDLRAHQLGVMAGMRAALEGVLQRFDPKQLEGKLTHRSAISSLIPATRKAKLWESFQELFAQLQNEAQDDFEELFGRAFLRAYEDQLDRMRAEPGPT